MSEPLRKRRPEPEHRRTLQHVRRNSRIAGGEWEKGFRHRLGRKARNRLITAAEIFERTTRPPGERNGAIGHVGVELLKLLSRLAHKGSGYLHPSIETLAKLLRRSMSAVHAAKERLKAHGFLAWARRFVEVDGAGHERGPQVQQTSNLYALALPAKAAARLDQLSPPPPMPSDQAQAIAERAAAIEAYARDDDDDPLVAALNRLGEGVARRNANPPKPRNP